MRIVVLGAGISGVTTAYYLAKLGHEVTVVDRQPQAGEETSFANGGVIGGTQIVPWASPGLPLKLLGWIGREDAPLLLRLKQVPHMWRWGLEFLRSCTDARLQESIRANLGLTLYSMERFKALRAETGFDYDLNTRGVLKVVQTQQALDEVAATYAPLRALGLVFDAKSATECMAIEPALANSAGKIVGGIHFPREEVGDCRRFAVGLAAECTRLGVTFQLGANIRGLALAGHAVEAVATDRGLVTADRFVVALASHSPVLLRGLGLRVPICPVKGVSVTLPAGDWPDAVKGGVIDSSRLFGLMRLGDRLRLAGSAEITGYDAQPSPARCAALVANAVELFPELKRCLAQSQPIYWAGLRGASPDGRPILGATPVSNLFLNAGHGPQGWSTSCGCASAVADVVAGRSPAIDLTAFALARFNGS
jgi:D-amino-acid dehydrogenase